MRTQRRSARGWSRRSARGGRWVVEPEGEFVAAEASGGAVLGEDLGQLGEQRVAGGVAEGVVDVLEVIDVAQQQDARLVGVELLAGVLDPGAPAEQRRSGRHCGRAARARRPALTVRSGVGDGGVAGGAGASDLIQHGAVEGEGGEGLVGQCPVWRRAGEHAGERFGDLDAGGQGRRGRGRRCGRRGGRRSQRTAPHRRRSCWA